jgi:hypothetical protein
VKQRLQKERALIGPQSGLWPLLPQLAHIPERHDPVPALIVVGPGGIISPLAEPDVVGPVA